MPDRTEVTIEIEHVKVACPNCKRYLTVDGVNPLLTREDYLHILKNTQCSICGYDNLDVALPNWPRNLKYKRYI